MDYWLWAFWFTSLTHTDICSKLSISEVVLVLLSYFLLWRASHMKENIFNPFWWRMRDWHIRIFDFFQDTTHSHTFCTKAAVRIDQFIIVCCWLFSHICMFSYFLHLLLIYVTHPLSVVGVHSLAYLFCPRIMLAPFSLYILNAQCLLFILKAAASLLHVVS